MTKFIFKKSSRNEKESRKIFEKNKLEIEDIHVLISLNYLLYATRSQVKKYITKMYSEDTSVAIALNKLTDLNLVEEYKLEEIRDLFHYSSNSVFYLTEKGYYHLENYYQEEYKRIPNHKPKKLNKEVHNEILNRLSFNNLYLKIIENAKRTYLSYKIDDYLIEGRFVIPTEHYINKFLNVYVIAFRNNDTEAVRVVDKINKIYEHCKKESQKAPWVMLICEDENHQKIIYKILDENNVLENKVILLTKDTYLIDDVDPFDNIVSFKKESGELLSTYTKLVI